MPDLGEPGVWPAQDIHIGDIIEIPMFHLNVQVTARDMYATGVTLDWETTGPGHHVIGVSAYAPDAPVRRLQATEVAA
jgi:hypothetical protein